MVSINENETSRRLRKLYVPSRIRDLLVAVYNESNLPSSVCISRSPNQVDTIDSHSRLTNNAEIFSHASFQSQFRSHDNHRHYENHSLITTHRHVRAFMSVKPRRARTSANFVIHVNALPTQSRLTSASPAYESNAQVKKRN